jgi:DNA-binding GntR family transcriptional regulator
MTLQSKNNSEVDRSRARARKNDVYDRLLRHITGPEIPIDGRLVEDTLATRFEVSRTPVREALQRLEQDGLVVHTTGWYVRPPTVTGARNVFEYRIAIEGYAARLAAERISKAELEVLEVLLDDMERSSITRDELNSLNERFHDQVTAASGNQRLADGRQSASIKYWAFRTPITFPAGDLITANRQHRDMVAALAARDGDAAESVTREHIEATQKIVLAGLAFLGPS